MKLGMVFLPEERIQILVFLAQSFKSGLYIQAWQWLHFLGLMMSTFQVVEEARLFIRPI